MSDFVLADGFGNLSDGLHTAGVTREILGEQWASFANNFTLVDLGDGRKYIQGAGTNIDLQTGTWSGLSTIWLSIRLYRYSSSQSMLFCLRNSVGVVGFLGLTSAGQVCYDTSATPGLSRTIVSTSSIPTGAWTNIECKIVIDDAPNGQVVTYINGVLDKTTSSIDTLYLGSDCEYLICLGGAGPVYSPFPTGFRVTDIIVHTAAASIGVAGVFYRPANGDGVDTDFTPSAGTNYQCVDEIGPDEDTTYNESDGTSGHRDSLEQAGVSGVTVLSVQSLVRARKTASGSASLLVGAVHSGSETQGAANALSSSYLTLTDFFDDCPSTAAAWTPAQVTDGEVSYEVV